MLSEINIQAVFIATIANLTATFVCGSILVRFTNGSEAYLPFSFILGSALMALGGYVAASLSDEYKLYNATAVALIGVVISIPFYSSLPLWYASLAILTMLPFAYMGGTMVKKI